MARRFTKSFKRSGYEDKISDALDEAGIGNGYETKTLHFEERVRGGRCARCDHDVVLKHRKYLVDFHIPRPRPMGDLYIEAKGRLTAKDRTKMIAVKKSNPDFDIRFMFMRREKLKLKRTPYNTDWAEANGFPYVVGHEVPEDWL